MLHKHRLQFELQLLSYFILCFAKANHQLVPERLLIDQLMDGYDPRVRPVKNVKDTVNISFSLSLMQIIDLDEKNQLLTTSMYMGWSWHDEFLQWNASDYAGISELRLPATSVWRPDILIYNSASVTFDQMLKTNVIVSHNGTVEWLPPGLFKTTCHVDIVYFPFDEQECSIKFGAWTYHGKLVDLILKKVDAETDSYTPSGEWELLSMKGKRSLFEYKCCPNNPFVDITYKIRMKRRPLFFGFNLLLPCILISSLTIVVFVLPADSGERITLGITILLSLVVFLQMVAEILPPSDVTPILVKYFALSIIMVGASVVTTVLSLNFHQTKAANAHPMPKLIRWIFLKILPKLLCMKETGTASHRRKFLNDSAKLLDDCNEKLNQSPHLTARKDIEFRSNQQRQINKDAEIFREAQKEMNNISQKLKYITNRMQCDDEDEKIALEWKFASSVMDRSCLYFFMLYFITSTVLTIGCSNGNATLDFHHG